jgi:hypothetical protein
MPAPPNRVDEICHSILPTAIAGAELQTLQRCFPARKQSRHVMAGDFFGGRPEGFPY